MDVYEFEEWIGEETIRRLRMDIPLMTDDELLGKIREYEELPARGEGDKRLRNLCLAVLREEADERWILR